MSGQTMKMTQSILEQISAFVWGPVTMILLLGTGLFLTAGLKAMPWRRLPEALRLLFSKEIGETAGGNGEISPFKALMTALSATVGTGNIAGVATAIHLGGPGAIFWMWMTALLGMATKYGEAVLAVKYREVDEDGRYLGGPMYYIKNGLGPKWAWLGSLFAIFAICAAFGAGSTVQANSLADIAEAQLGIPNYIVAISLCVLVGMVLLGGVQRIATVAGRLVPFMVICYIGGSLIVLGMHATDVPAALTLIVSDAFTGTAATGGFAGAGIAAAIRFGVARGIFSNEAGLGSAPIAHAAAKTNDPVKQGAIGMLGTFIDTILVCSMTALVILVTGVWETGETGVPLTAAGFDASFAGGGYIVTFSLMIFAFTTILGWSLYGERSVEYLLGPKAIVPFKFIYVAAVAVGAVAGLDLVWLFADITNGLMAIPNLIALLLLSPVIFRITNERLAGDRMLAEQLEEIAKE